MNDVLNKPNSKELQRLFDEKNYKDILDIKEKLSKAIDKKDVNKLYDEFIKISGRISSGK